MLRLLRTAALFMLLGAVTTICVSWAFAALGSTPNLLGLARGSSLPFVKPGEVVPWPPHVPADWPSPRTLAQSTGRGLRQDYATSVTGTASLFDEAPSTRFVYMMAGIRSGWPMQAMRITSLTVRSPDGAEVVSRTPSIGLPDWFQAFVESNTRGFRGRRALPLTPIPAGFVANTAMYGAFFWLVLRSRNAVRTALRHRRHQCLECGYPIGTALKCTECGASVSPKTA